MKETATFYHAGCPVCVDAEQTLVNTIDRERFDIEIVNLGEAKNRIATAEGAGVRSVPALVVAGNAYHINFGADIADLK